MWLLSNYFDHFSSNAVVVTITFLTKLAPLFAVMNFACCVFEWFLDMSLVGSFKVGVCLSVSFVVFCVRLTWTSLFNCASVIYNSIITVYLAFKLNKFAPFTFEKNGLERFITFRASRRRREMYCGHVSVCLSVCLSVCVSACLHYCTDPDVTWEDC